MILRENTTSTVLLASTPKSLTPASEGQRGRGLPLPSLALPFLPSEMKPNYNNHEARHQNGRLKLKAFVRRFQHSSTPSPASTSLHQDCATASNRRCNLDFNSGSFRCCKQKEAGGLLETSAQLWFYNLLFARSFTRYCYDTGRSVRCHDYCYREYIARVTISSFATALIIFKLLLSSANSIL